MTDKKKKNNNINKNVDIVLVVVGEYQQQQQRQQQKYSVNIIISTDNTSLTHILYFNNNHNSVLSNKIQKYEELNDNNDLCFVFDKTIDSKLNKNKRNKEIK